MCSFLRQMLTHYIHQLVGFIKRLFHPSSGPPSSKDSTILNDTNPKQLKKSNSSLSKKHKKKKPIAPTFVSLTPHSFSHSISNSNSNSNSSSLNDRITIELDPSRDSSDSLFSKNSKVSTSSIIDLTDIEENSQSHYNSNKTDDLFKASGSSSPDFDLFPKINCNQFNPRSAEFIPLAIYSTQNVSAPANTSSPLIMHQLKF